MPKESPIQIGRYRAQPCNCGYDGCPDWHVWPNAAIRDVYFTKKQAIAVATVLDQMDRNAAG